VTIDIADGEKEKETPEPRWKKIDNISSELEKIFFEKSTEEKLSPYEMSIIINRVNLLFDEYKMLLMSQHSAEIPNVKFNGTNIYK